MSTVQRKRKLRWGRVSMALGGAVVAAGCFASLGLAFLVALGGASLVGFAAQRLNKSYVNDDSESLISKKMLKYSAFGVLGVAFFTYGAIQYDMSNVLSQKHRPEVTPRASLSAQFAEQGSVLLTPATKLTQAQLDALAGKTPESDKNKIKLTNNSSKVVPTPSKPSTLTGGASDSKVTSTGTAPQPKPQDKPKPTNPTTSSGTDTINSPPKTSAPNPNQQTLGKTSDGRTVVVDPNAKVKPLPPANNVQVTSSANPHTYSW